MRPRNPPPGAPLIEMIERAERREQNVGGGKKLARLMNRRTDTVPTTPWTRDRQRESEVAAIIRHRHGPRGCQDVGELGERYVVAVAPHVIKLARERELDPHDALRGWVHRHCPAILNARGGVWIRGIVANPPRMMRANAIGHWLAVLLTERTAIKLKSIRAIGMKRSAQRYARKLADREYQRAKRAEEARKAGKTYTPQKASISATEPWKAHGVGRTKFYEMVTAGLVRDPRKPGSRTVSSASARTVSSACKKGSRTVSSALDRLRLSSTCRRIRPHDDDSDTRIRAFGQTTEPASQLDLIALPPADVEKIRTQLDGYDSGIMPAMVAGALRDAYRARGRTQEAFADQVDISRPQIANGLCGRFGFSPEVVARIKTWLAEQEVIG